MMILQAPYEQIQTTTYLPSPQLGDKVSPVAQVTRKVSMDNTKYTYVRRKGRRKLQLQFDLHRNKAFELQAFVAVYLTADIRLTFANGEVWKVKLTNNPFEYITTSRGNYLTVELQLEGIKTNAANVTC